MGLQFPEGFPLPPLPGPTKLYAPQDNPVVLGDKPWYDPSVQAEALYLDDSGEAAHVALVEVPLVDDRLDEMVVRGFFEIARLHWYGLTVTWVQMLEDEHGLTSPTEVSMSGLVPILIQEGPRQLLFWQVDQGEVIYAPMDWVTKMAVGQPTGTGRQRDWPV